MNTIGTDSLVDLFLQLKWKSDQADHTDCYQAGNVNMWRDILPHPLCEGLLGTGPGDTIDLHFDGGQAVPAFENRNLMQIKTQQFDTRAFGKVRIEPAVGRFYPKGVLSDIAGVFKENVAPFRCVALNNGHMSVDFNHPLAEKELMLSAIVGKIEPKYIERGGTSIDWVETLAAGPGMQARWRNRPTEYMSPNAFARADNTPDARFYHAPRFTQHLDDTALAVVSNTYGRFLKDGLRVLDLMSSWQSHVPAKFRFERLTGLGLNHAELKRNQQLTEAVVHDLNVDRVLPFDDNSFDVVLCTASIEYLTEPLAVFREVARVLDRNGSFVVTFSNRWFPPKVIGVWTELHEFERVGLVLEYFIRSGAFEDLHTYSLRGLPRPSNDKYFPAYKFSDPLYAVWGRKK
jgi:SAM-dependent methyltransferase